jgi:transcriptional regulator with XRE-family HTH domain
MKETSRLRNNRIGDTVKQGRKVLGYSQEILGDIAGVYATYIGQIELGKRVPSDEVCTSLAYALNLDPNHLLFLAHTERAKGSTRALMEQIEGLIFDQNEFSELLQSTLVNPSNQTSLKEVMSKILTSTRLGSFLTDSMKKLRIRPLRATQSSYQFRGASLERR